MLRHGEPCIVDVGDIVGLVDGSPGIRTGLVAIVGVVWVAELRHTAAGSGTLIVVTLPSSTTVRKDASPRTGGFAKAVVPGTPARIRRALVVIATEIMTYLVCESILADAASVDG